MRVDIRVAISDDFSYEYDKMVMKEVQVKGDPEVLSSIPWGRVLGGVVEGALGEFSVKEAILALKEIESQEDEDASTD